MAFLRKMTHLFMVMFIALTVFSCGGGGGGGGSNGGGGTGGGDITIPAPGATGTVTFTAANNKYGFHSLWSYGGETGDYLSIKHIFNSRNAEIDDDKCTLYFSDDYVFVFLGDDSAQYYLFVKAPYQYNSTTGEIILTGSNTLNSLNEFLWLKASFSVDAAVILLKDSERYDLLKAQKIFSFSGTVTVLDDATRALLDDDEDEFDNTLVCPTINSLSAAYSGGSVSVDYNITAPAGKNINFIEFKMVSPLLYEKCLENDEYYSSAAFPIYGQAQNIYQSISTAANSVTGTASLSLPGAENGKWYIAKVNIRCDDGTWYELTMEVQGDWVTTYHYRDDDTDKYKNTGFAAATFDISGSTADTTPPTLTGLSVSGTTVTINASDNLSSVTVICVPSGHYAEEDSVSDHWGGATVTGSTATFNGSYLSAGSYYIALIALFDAAGNCSVYCGYDTTVSFWAGDFSFFGVDFSKFNRYWANEKLPDVTTFSNAVFTVGAGAPPAVPSNLNVGSATTSSLTVSWNAVSGATSYKLYRSSSESGSYSLVTTTGGNGYTDSSLSEGTTYYYKVSAVNSYGESSLSSAMSGTTLSSGGGGTPFTPGTGSFSISEGTYSLTSGGTTVSYTFKSGNLIDMTAGGSTVSDMTYSYNTSDGSLTFSQDLGGGYVMSYTYYNCFTVDSGGSVSLYMPGFKKTSGDASSIVGTYEYGMSTDVMGTVTSTTVTMTYSSDGTYSVTTSVTGQPDQTATGTWDTSANTVSGYSFAAINGGLYMYVPGSGYLKE